MVTKWMGDRFVLGTLRSLQTNSVETLQKSFQWDCKLRSPIMAHVHIYTQKINRHIKAQEDFTPRGNVQNLQWTSPVPHQHDQTSPTTILQDRCSHCQQLSLITTRTQYRGGSFLPCTIRDWNSLSKDAVEAMTVDTFLSRASYES